MLSIGNSIVTLLIRTFTSMKHNKEKSEAEKSIEKLKDRPLPKDAQEAVKKKQAYVNREINK